MKMKRGLPITLAVLALALLAAPAALAGDKATSHPAQLTLANAHPYWASYADYRQRLLTVEEEVASANGCRALTITAITASSGADARESLPLELGAVEPGQRRPISVKFAVPQGVQRFKNRFQGSCTPPEPAAAYQLTMTPDYAVSNEGCPVAPAEEMEGHPLPADDAYQRRRFTVTMSDSNGAPISGKSVKWSLSNEVDFRIVEESGVTDSLGQASVLVAPPEYFVGVSPYYSKGSTKVIAQSEGGSAQALFVYMRCTPPGSTPPWAEG